MELHPSALFEGISECLDGLPDQHRLGAEALCLDAQRLRRLPRKPPVDDSTEHEAEDEEDHLHDHRTYPSAGTSASASVLPSLRSIHGVAAWPYHTAPLRPAGIGSVSRCGA